MSQPSRFPPTGRRRAPGELPPTQARPTLPGRLVPPPPLEARGRSTVAPPTRSRMREALSAARRQAGALPPPAPSRPLSGRGRWIIRAVVLLLLLGGGVIAWTQGSASPAGTGPAAHSPAAPAPSAASPGQPTLPPQATSTSPALSAQAALQVTAQFLAAYFSWSASERDATYIQGWQPLVQPIAGGGLLMAAPRSALDQGEDAAASSPQPRLGAAACHLENPQAVVQATWPIRVLPSGGELVQWQARLIQATVWLTQSPSGWQVSATSWQVVPQGGA